MGYGYVVSSCRDKDPKIATLYLKDSLTCSYTLYRDTGVAMLSH